MFDLEKSIADWRRQMLTGGMNSPQILDELESHLREETLRLISQGLPANEAFETSRSRLGNSDSLHHEFNKLINRPPRFIALTSTLFAFLLLLLAVSLLGGSASGRLTPLLSLHIFSLTAGYCAVLVAGAFAISGVFYRWTGLPVAQRNEAIHRAGLILTRISVGLIAIGLLTGMLWAKKNLGHYGVGNPRGLGPVLALGWLIAALMLERRSRSNIKTLTTLLIAGNLVIGASWFGAGLLAAGPAAWGICGIVILGCIACLHVFFLGMNLAPRCAKLET
jgi:hypothetical protein